MPLPPDRRAAPFTCWWLRIQLFVVAGFGISGLGFRFTLLAITRNLLPILLVGGLFCYWLAKYLSTPMEQLRGVAQELSEGKLTARVDQ